MSDFEVAVCKREGVDLFAWEWKGNGWGGGRQFH